MTHPQLPLVFPLNESYVFDGFISEDGEQILHSLKEVSIGEGGQLTYLYGTQGSGRSHLLQATCHGALVAGRSSIYLPLAELINHSPSALDGLEALDLVAIDDLDTLLEEDLWQEALFHLFNRILQSNTSLIFTASQPPGKLSMALADLRSRLESCLILQVKPLPEALLPELIRRRAERRGIEISDEVIEYILRREIRDNNALLELIDRLNQASLAAQRRVTIPFIRSIMKWP